ncbi:MAG TPA: flagellar assembly protein FliX [Xanthobacteraceae bacterium]|jgi:hypothetical protein|nr:flagellar assembly protein FliX [Xanthobacteraceae bacterium]
MRISAPSSTNLASTSPVARRTTGSGFAVEGDAAPRASAPAGGPRMVGGIDALIALQGVEDPLMRRKRAVQRGRVALDALEELKIGLLGGILPPAILAKLRSAAAQLQLDSGEGELNAVLAEIELRVEVEIAKMTSR